MGHGVGFPEGFWFGVRFLFLEGRHVGPLSALGRALDFPPGLGLVLGVTISDRPYLWQLPHIGSWHLPSFISVGVLIIRNHDRWLLTVVVTLDTLVA